MSAQCDGRITALCAPGPFWWDFCDEGCRAVKKLIALVIAVAGGLALWRRFQQDRAERDLWTEATSASSRD